MPLTEKNILLGVSAGIAAYKSCELVRLLTGAGARVRVVMTPRATEFVAPLTFQALSGHPVRTAVFDAEAEAGMDHISLARWADAILVAPATADVMARLAHGMADDLLSTLCLATEAPVCLAPAMNRAMWGHVATRENARLLASRGVHLFGPGTGGQACGEIGAGRMLEPAELLQSLQSLFEAPRLAGRHVLVTAGPTREPVDPVRYITNRSSGRMGHAVAAAAALAGARVTLVSGPVALEAPAGVERLMVETAEQMQETVMALVPGADIFIATAAVADYRMAQPAQQKIKKQGDTLDLQLVKNPDILAQVAASAGRPFTVGFAAETDSLEQHARAKLESKRLDMIAANDVSDGQGFDVHDNALRVFWSDGDCSLPRQSKVTLARALVQVIADRFELARGQN
ncbi:bifunctional phosphopantothenoylcysteine decarboxylase/phosphopantothenate--cysteine ligase CoaBC [Ectothiorhodospira variabilis]|uniref:bifunctional phosphopantothenoylcysteine decarboxylase/phosphopantothenate--cysteine ligase CoaBC n=1 Tax=Ectothiorhodospira variabilis TaxID=505694 RepID=UPI001EFA646C|nr:bifunctional phosphopantothenoylcysteine decarboxylase/phosphopantothenate--cysteine ligase CoaBC [Ectothiorhodospira variabilis]MCG5494720.1 bifunctional phosphopantothenoylcysteine decarboxylase/phosphopantothenate--cysteine ligase CoaBC [Ectothiorhodospira variabilis]MCG5503516.1 bifunctional phosphopantothenoylcysteine decarboxylase/phosphopantothenate--cysteine ligase CoaBC [Ectothiorhodospira variabilis]MCG5506769.1 bifunctional phosphopantothenoylcysteine decarboxylase/phosphopantothen